MGTSFTFGRSLFCHGGVTRPVGAGRVGLAHQGPGALSLGRVGVGDATFPRERANYGDAFAVALTRSEIGVRRRRRVRRGSPAFTRRMSCAWRRSNASATARLRTTRAQARKRLMGASPITRHQPLPISIVAGSLIRAFARSAAERLAQERRQALER